MPESVEWRAILWSIIPGLGHLKTAHRQIGRVLLYVWMGFLFAALLSIGTEWMLYFLMGAILIHALAFLQLLANNIVYESMLIRAVFGTLVFLCLYFGLYRPVGLLTGQVCVIEVLDRVTRNRVVDNGDGLLIEGAWLRPDRFERGDFVLYVIEPYIGVGFIVQGGRSVDRIIGVPGDRVERIGAEILVNGEPPKPGEEPAGVFQLGGDFSFELGPREYAILTTVDVMNPYGPNQRPPANIVQHLTVFDDDEILGRVIYRIRPFSRMGRI